MVLKQLFYSIPVIKITHIYNFIHLYTYIKPIMAVYSPDSSMNYRQNKC